MKIKVWSGRCIDVLLNDTFQAKTYLSALFKKRALRKAVLKKGKNVFYVKEKKIIFEVKEKGWFC